MRLANFLASIWTRARSARWPTFPTRPAPTPPIVALACDQVVVHPRAVLGGSGGLRAERPTRSTTSGRLIRETLAPRKGRSWSLMAAMIDPNLTVYRATRLGEVEYFCDEELARAVGAGQMGKGRTRHHARQAAEDRRHPGRRVSPGQPRRRKLRPIQAILRTGKRPDAGRARLGRLPDSGAGLAGRGRAVAVHRHRRRCTSNCTSPGIGVGGFVAAVCFLLFFWSRYLGGTAGWLEVTLFVAGVACLLLEVFVIPGFGIFGLGGGAMVLASLILASQTFVWPRNDYQFEQLQNSLLTIAAASVGVIVVAVLLRKRLPRSRLFGNLMLEPPAGEEAEIIRRREALVDFHDLVGTRGTATTQLTPSGKARFGDVLVDVMADGEVIDRGAAIEVVEVRGSRVLVQGSGEDRGEGIGREVGNVPRLRSRWAACGFA